MSQIKLVYFDLRGRAEFIRMILEAAGKKYEDERVTREDWPRIKQETPFGQLPILEYNGKVYAQSYAIGVFLAKEFGMYGKTNLDRLRIDEVYGLVSDQVPNLIKARFGQTEEEKEEYLKKVVDEDIPRFLDFYEKLLEENNSTGFFVGNTISLADLAVYDMVDNYLALKKGCLKGYPLVQKLRKNIRAHPFLNAYLANRKETPF